MSQVAIPRPEYPRPQFVRDSFVNLNGSWQFERDPGESGRQRGLPASAALSERITVPFCPESELSGLGYKDFMNCVWYSRLVDVPAEWLANGRRTLLHFGACDYHTEVFVGGASVGTHIGGYTSFHFDITDHLAAGENRITVCATDHVRSGAQPVGKQCTDYASRGCSYTRTTGIWQTVWMENVPGAYVVFAKNTPNLRAGSLLIEAVCENAHGMTLVAEAFFAGKKMGEITLAVRGRLAQGELFLAESHPWCPESPALYDLTFALGEDRVTSYFGLREIVYEDGKFLLNGRAIFQRLILDQGFYPDGIYTAPTDEELRMDIQRAQDMGFNGARLHEKIFEERFLYHCDRMGYLVWGEHANWGLNIARPEAWQGFFPEWLESLRRDYNHPALVGWCPLNETQEDQNPEFVKFLAALTRAWDRTRPFIDASGWHHVGEVSDIIDAHDYDQNPATFAAKLDAVARGEKIRTHRGGPILPTFISEFGGIRWSDDQAGWGYGEAPKTEAEFLARYKGLVDALLDRKSVCGFCYTQLTDVEQEQNGLYTYARKPKFDPAVIRAITARKAAIEEGA